MTEVTEENFWEILENDPIAAMQSPWFDLLTLENPGRCLEVEAEYIGGWIEDGIRRLSLPNQRLLAADLAEHVLPIFEASVPGDLRPRRAIEAARLPSVTKAQLKHAMFHANTAGKAVEYRSDEGPAFAAYACAWAVSSSPAEDKWFAIECADRAVDAFWHGNEHRCLDEWRWQWARVLWYLRTEAASAAPLPVGSISCIAK